MRYTKEQALKDLETNRQITTNMLKYLPMSFEMWLMYCKADKSIQDQCVDLAIETLKIV